ncbi:hypothetical protein Trichorick_00788 [Candidatus Trichorickettsia mobilis]|uniref:Uncharacterized protein n=1 Tax=Candidatus Trichorickettsia mobilis TaxID=1346319 RepID=A0ABZ0UTD4_9RICK|nr:hypothetical protein Trichorick_00788 [Candidatus Trichorickettsia mobilis]
MKHHLKPISNSILDSLYTKRFLLLNHNFDVNRMELLTTTLAYDEEYEVTKLYFQKAR